MRALQQHYLPRICATAKMSQQSSLTESQSAIQQRPPTDQPPVVQEPSPSSAPAIPPSASAVKDRYSSQIPVKQPINRGQVLRTPIVERPFNRHRNKVGSYVRLFRDLLQYDEDFYKCYRVTIPQFYVLLRLLGSHLRGPEIPSDISEEHQLVVGVR